MTGHWHLFAIGALFSVLALKTGRLLFFLSLLLLWLFYLYIYKRFSIIIIICTVITFIVFYLYFPSYEASRDSLPNDINNHTVTISGKIVSNVDHSDRRLSFILLEENTKKKVLVTYFQNDDIIETFPYTYSAICFVTGEMQIPDEATNPFEFNFRQYLFEKGILLQIIVDSTKQIVCNQQSSILQQIYSLRSLIIKKSNETLHPTVAAWQQALILGNSDKLDDHVKVLFQRWGLSHLLAISGLHVAIIVTMIYFFLKRILQFTNEKARIFVLIFLPIYAILAGGQPSVWRATLMTVVVLFITAKKIKLTNLDILSIVFLSLIIIDKYLIFHVGFQFSFAVTLGLILSIDWFKQANNILDRGLKISFIAQMMIVPLQMYYFYYFQPLSILLNVLIVPYFSLFVIPYMFVSFVFIFLPQKMVHIIELIFITIHQFVISFIEFLDRFMNAPFISGEISLEVAILYYIFLILLMIHLEKRNNRQAFIYGLLLTLTLIYVISQPYLSKEGTVTMLDVGQGDAFIIELPYRKGVFIIDAGASFDFETFEPSESVFKRVIRPYLMGRGIQTIDAIFVTHADLDHHGSVRYIMEQFNVKEVITHTYFNIKDKEFNIWEQHETKITHAKFLDKIKRNGQTFYILGPRRDHNDENNNSLVLYTNLGGKYWLFTGDISKSEEREITEQFPFLDIDVLKIAHHGSHTSTDENLLETFKPSYAFISVGRNNQYGHPAKEVIDTLNKYDVTIFRTDEHGAVQFKYDDSRVKISSHYTR